MPLLLVDVVAAAYVVLADEVANVVVHAAPSRGATPLSLAFVVVVVADAFALVVAARISNTVDAATSRVVACALVFHAPLHALAPIISPLPVATFLVLVAPPSSRCVS